MSFRGEGFTSYLYDALIQQGYKTFFDDENLARGKAISKGLLKAIKIRYEYKGQIVLPIFYHVDPSHVRNQRESYRKAFEKHESNSELSPMEVDRWRKALKEVANLSGFPLTESDVEAKFVKKFIEHISNILEVQKDQPKDMPINVFGKPIIDLTSQEMAEYTGKEITATDRSRVAMKMIEAHNKEADALTFVKNLKSTYGNGVTTLCLIYNATGGTLKHVCDKNWFGHIGDALCPYKIENGQWGAFLHVHDTGAATGSIAATVYRGKNANGTVCEWMLSWYNPWGKWWDRNRVYTEIREKGHFAQVHWKPISNILEEQGPNHSITWNECVSSLIIEDGTSPIFKAVMKLVDA
ncbi:hypothetical protein FNV43_RR08506 [Rhamnella rubrinervis]|uniref:TIR domain-containing protein n=1 Tax=Rhamnella rubrinervis TaxID=2594499 RepID=A0A8K0MJ04_9ROSA|nr:hypothetical protein FNV43_RR08506 [Rhamnella rubrinervis]